ncbi:MAG: ribonuclease III domain-containing protein [Candidatus Sericytochromatia bacterium]|nr:ribonuclease III domain-containing protein [Candidatus Sericytochromatia bacterium]
MPEVPGAEALEEAHAGRPAKLLAEIHPRDMAYLGDAVHELEVRRRGLARPLQGDARHRETVRRVRAVAQARVLRELEPDLAEDEREVVRRARALKRLVTRSADPGTYRWATAFEAWIGYLWLLGRHERLAWVLARAEDMVDLPPASQEGPEEDDDATRQEARA